MLFALRSAAFCIMSMTPVTSFSRPESVPRKGSMSARHMAQHPVFPLHAILVALVLSLISYHDFASAQEAASSDRASIQSLKDSIKNYNEELSLLQHFLEASTVDSRILQHTNIKSWILNNPTLRDSLFYALMEVDSSIQSEAGTDAEVLATEANDLIEVRFGTAVFKGMTLKDALDKSNDKLLYRKVVDSYRYSKDIELRNPSFRLPTYFETVLIPSEKLHQDFAPLTLVSNPHPVNARVDLSLFGVMFRAGPTWGGEIRIGNDEIGYPFWSSGKIAFMATYEGKVKFGFELPFQPGRSSSELFPPFIIRGRRLNGTRGIVGEIDFGTLGASFSITRLTDSDTDALTDPANFAFVTAIVNAYYSFGVALNPTNLVRVKIGGGIHRINDASVQQRPVDLAGGRFEQVLIRGTQKLYASPYAKFEYVNKEVTDRFRASIQFYDLALLIGGSVELVPNVLSIEAKYAWPIGPDLKEWQNADFFIVSPRLRLSF